MLAQTPPMGWNSWNTFGWEISEELIKETADMCLTWIIENVISIWLLMIAYP